MPANMKTANVVTTTDKELTDAISGILRAEKESDAKTATAAVAIVHGILAGEKGNTGGILLKLGDATVTLTRELLLSYGLNKLDRAQKGTLLDALASLSPAMIAAREDTKRYADMTPAVAALHTAEKIAAKKLVERVTKRLSRPIMFAAVVLNVERFDANSVVIKGREVRVRQTVGKKSEMMSLSDRMVASELKALTGYIAPAPRGTKARDGVTDKGTAAGAGEARVAAGQTAAVSHVVNDPKDASKVAAVVISATSLRRNPEGRKALAGSLHSLASMLEQFVGNPDTAMREALLDVMGAAKSVIERDKASKGIVAAAMGADAPKRKLTATPPRGAVNLGTALKEVLEGSNKPTDTPAA